jgi:hypothetical protein
VSNFRSLPQPEKAIRRYNEEDLPFLPAKQDLSSEVVETAEGSPPNPVEAV